MKKSSMLLTVAQFAKLHEVNKRTLHYYDSIGLFSPHIKGDNGYRYYELSQSIDFEYIRMLKELNMSIEEIRAWLKHPDPHQFIKIAETKEQEIETQIRRLKQTEKILQTKREQIRFCTTLQEQEIKLLKCEEEEILILPYDFSDHGLSRLFSYVKDKWSIEQIRMGIGGFLSLDKARDNDFDAYDGLYTPALSHSLQAESRIKPEGMYLCGYQKGSWDKLPDMYRKMFAFAETNQLHLTGYCYEMGMNEFVISDQEDYITQIMIKIQQ